MANLNENIEALFKNMESFVSTKTVVGEVMNVGDNIILPLIDVSFGVGAGTAGSNNDKNSKESVGGGLGAKISPSAVIVINGGDVRLMNVKASDPVSKIIDMAPNIISKFTKRKENEEIINSGVFSDNDSEETEENNE